MKGRKACLKALTSLLSPSMTTFTSCDTIGSWWVCEDPEMLTGMPVTTGSHNALPHATKKPQNAAFLLTHRGDRALKKCPVGIFSEGDRLQGGILTPSAPRISQRKNSLAAVFLLTHRGSNPDSSEPKSDVLPITPWVNRRLIRRGKSRNFFYFRIALSRKR